MAVSTKTASISHHFPRFRYGPFLLGKNTVEASDENPYYAIFVFIIIYNYFHVFTIYFSRLFWNVSMFAVYLYK
jgi:hypothetical protein